MMKSVKKGYESLNTNLNFVVAHETNFLNIFMNYLI
jgi:hypothetical protein